MADIPLMKPSITEDEVDIVAEAVRSGWLSHHGQHINKFENEFAEYLGVDNAITTTSGTSALRLAAEALGIGDGDEVIVPTLSYIGTVSPLIHAGAKLRFVDVTSEFSMDPSALRDAISSDTSAVVVAHLFGMTGDIDLLSNIAAEHGAVLIEDAAESLGARVSRDRYAGTVGDAGIFSFTGTKMLSTGQGGMVVTESDDLAAEMDHLKHHATLRRKDYRHDQIGFNFCMSNIQAALGRVQLDRYDEMLEDRREVCRWYIGAIGVRVDRTVEIRPNPADDSAVWWHPVIQFGSGEQRLRVENNLEEEGIDVRRIFYPLPWQPAIQPVRGDAEAKKAAEIYEQSLLLPCWPEMEIEQVQAVVDVIVNSLNR